MSLSLPPQVAAQANGVPEGWFKSGMAPDDYEVGTDTAVRRNGAASAFIRGLGGARSFGTLMQSFAADDYRGKRIRLVGYLMGRARPREGGLWLRVNGPERNGPPLRFDNTHTRVAIGREWTRAEIVIDVPREAVTINFGLLLSGEGHIWLDDVELAVVGTDVPLTGGGFPQLPTGPRNLDFERKRPPFTTLTDGR